MAVNQGTTYGSYGYASPAVGSAPATLYANNFVPETFSVPLAETITGSEADIVSTTKVLADALALVENRIFQISTHLADSVTATSAISKAGSKQFSESISLSEVELLSATKALSDLVILKEWISIRLLKNLVWVNPQENANIFDSLYAKTTMGPALYGGKNILYGGTRPASSWTAGTKRQEAWTQPDGHKYNS